MNFPTGHWPLCISTNSHPQLMSFPNKPGRRHKPPAGINSQLFSHFSNIVQLGLKLNPKLALDHHPPTHQELFKGF